MTIKELRAINQAKIKTLLKTNPTSPDLMRCQVVARILEDEQGFIKLSQADKVAVLTTIGLTPDSAAAWRP